MLHPRSKKILLALSIFLALFLAMRAWAFFSEPEKTNDFKNCSKIIHFSDNGFNFLIASAANSVSDLLEEKKIILGEHDRLTPEREAVLFPGMHVQIERATKIKITADGNTHEKYVFGKTVQAALRENQITLSRLDKTTPEKNALVQNNLLITVTRINIEEVTEKEAVAFKTTVKNDAKLGWQEKKIETPGRPGEKEVRYEITYKNSKEVSRVILNSKITKEPATQVEIHGTYMKLGKAASGQGTWYAYRGGLFAASTTIPKGAYAKVTNTANGKSIVVQINDYGPQGKGRVIDLDKVAFAKIASLGAGVIGVKVEPVLN